MVSKDDSLSLDHMRAFVAVAAGESQVRAAKRLHVSQATVHRYLKRVDAHFKGGLFEGGMGMRLSTRGTMVQRTLKSVLAALELDRDRLAVEQPVLRIGFIRTMRPLVERALRALIGVRRGAEFDVRLFELYSEEQARRILHHELDIAVCYALDGLFEKRVGLEESLLTDQPYALVVPERACRQGKLNRRALSPLHYVHVPRRLASDTDDAAQVWLHEHGMKPKIHVECRLGTELIAYAAAGRGYGFLPALWSTASHEGSAFVPAPGFTKTVRIATYSLEHVSPWVTPFRESLLSAVREALGAFP